MKLTEAEMRMVFQIESTNQNAALNEIYMTWRYAPNPATKETAESLLDKLRPLSDQEPLDSANNRCYSTDRTKEEEKEPNQICSGNKHQDLFQSAYCFQCH